MSRENKSSNPDLAEKLRHARTLLDECIAQLSGGTSRKTYKTLRSPSSRKLPELRSFDFDANERNFMKDHAKGLGAGKKFALLLAYLAKGEVTKEIQLKQIEAAWGRMTTLLGDFNRKYSSDAKEQGLVTTKKHGIYVLRPRWRDIIAGG
jgi:hypothetical protein